MASLPNHQQLQPSSASATTTGTTSSSRRSAAAPRHPWASTSSVSSSHHSAPGALPPATFPAQQPGSQRPPALPSTSTPTAAGGGGGGGGSSSSSSGGSRGSGGSNSVSANPRTSRLSLTFPSASLDRPAAQAQARTWLEASLGNLLDSELGKRAEILHDNAAVIAGQEREMVRATDALRRETDKLAKMAGDAVGRVKELGNVQNWAEMLERDFLLVEETLRLVRRGSESGSEGSGSWTGSEGASVDGSVVGEGEGLRADGAEEEGAVINSYGVEVNGGAVVDHSRDREGDVRMENGHPPTEEADKGKKIETEIWDAMNIDLIQEVSLLSSSGGKTMESDREPTDGQVAQLGDSADIHMGVSEAEQVT